MSKIPKKLLAAILADPFYKRCARHAEESCAGRITFEHAIIYAGKQLNEKWAIIPLCSKHHAVDEYQDGGDLDKRINLWIALNRASTDELLSISRANDYFRHMHRLNDQYGRYVEPEQVPQTGIMYPWLCSPHSLV